MDKTQIVLVTLIVYKLILVGIGVWASKRNQSGNDFFIGGRGLGPFVASLSYSSSAASAWALLGLSGIAYSYGASTIWVALGSITSMFVTWYWIAPRMMRFSREHNYITLSNVVTHHTSGPTGRRLLIAATIIIVFSFTFYVAAQFQAAGSTFATTFDMSMAASIVLGALIIMLYTLLGGFWAVSVTDALQGSLMALTAILLPIASFIAVGGFEGLANGLVEVASPAQLSFTAQSPFWFALGLIVGGLAIGIGTYGQPHLMARLIALRDEKAMRQARLITIVWYFLVFLGMWFVGLAGRVLFPDLVDAEKIFFVALDGLFSPVIAAILLAAVLSAIMSTADSQLLSAATALAHDLGLARKDETRVLIVSRLTIVSLVVLAVFIALTMPDKIFNRVLFAWMALGAAFGPILFARLANVRLKQGAVLLSVLSGFGLTVVLSFTPNAPGDVIERLLPFVVASVILIIGREPKQHA